MICLDAIEKYYTNAPSFGRRATQITIQITMKRLKQYTKTSLRQAIERALSKDSILTDVTVDAIIIDQTTYDVVEHTGFIVEAKHQFPYIPGTKYTFRIDQPNGEPRPGNQKHIHIYGKKGQLVAMNVDGSAHDGYHQVRIPDDVVPFLQKKGFTLPPDNIVEFYMQPVEQTLLLEQLEDTMMPEPALSTEFAMWMGAIIRRSEAFQLVESNLQEPYVRMHSKVVNTYTHVQRIALPELCTDYECAKDMLLHTLDDYPNFIPEIMQIFDSSNHEHQLFVVWKER